MRSATCRPRHRGLRDAVRRSPSDGPKISMRLSDEGRSGCPGVNLMAAIDLKQSARKYVLAALPYDQGDQALVAYLNGLDAFSLLVAYHNWMSRLIQPRPRKVQVSVTLEGKLPQSKHASAIAKIKGDIETGMPLTKYLSRGVRVAAGVPRPDAKFNRRRDLDLMLTSWQMHHLHLSVSEEADGFVSRTEDLLFAVFRRDDAYLVDIMPHGSWSREHLLKVALEELPEAGAVHVIEGATGLAHTYTDEEHQTLRNVGINGLRVIDDKVVMPAGSISTAGTSLAATRAATAAIEALEGFEASWADHPYEIRKIAREGGSIVPDDPEFAFFIADEFGAGVLERKSGAFFPFPR